MARKPTFRNNKAIVDSLNDLGNVSRFLALKLVDMGYVAIRASQTGFRGRPSHTYVVTGKGRQLVALARQWGKQNHYLRQNLRPVSNVVELAQFKRAA